jgi:hypothetical protein
MHIGGQPSMTAPHNPEKFLWKPGRLTSEPSRLSEAADAQDAFVDIRSTKGIKPAVKRNSIIVEKYDN